MAIDYFLPPWGLVLHTFGGVDPVDHNLIAAVVNGLRFDRNVVSVEPKPALTDFRLLQNYPNPFNPSTNIRFVLGAAAQVTLSIYNTRGQEVRSLVRGRFPAGEHELFWNGRDDNGSRAASGIYFLKMTAGTGPTNTLFAKTSRMLLLK